MNYQPSSHDFVVENRDAETFFVNREVFISEDVLEREKRAVFDRCWVYVGHASELKNPGDFKTRPVAGRPIIFCRDREGTVRALLNCCRHRGALVCREREGNARQFYCMYHGWTYHPDGRLKSVPGGEAYGPAFDSTEMGLVPVPRLESYRDFYFANFDRDAVDLDTYLGKAKEYLDLVVDQSPSGKMQIISGTQEYDIRANWKLLVENSVDDYHLISTHSTWLNYMRNSGVNVTPPKGELLPTRGFGRDLGNGHLTTDNPNYRGRPVAKWISVYGEDAKADIDAMRNELVQRLGSARAARVADTNRNLCIFPNLVINDGSSVTVRHFYPVAPDRMHVIAWALGPVEETEAQRARRLHAFLTFYGPGGFATPDDVAALEAAQLGFAAWREVPWSDLSRGMGKPLDQQLATDEGHIRVFWRKWNELMETRA
jgi:p-cumate 2,3-dioxygenase alpha subunit